MVRLSRLLVPVIASALIAAACSAPRATAPTASAAPSGSASAAPNFEGKTLNRNTATLIIPE